MPNRRTGGFRKRGTVRVNGVPPQIAKVRSAITMEKATVRSVCGRAPPSQTLFRKMRLNSRPNTAMNAAPAKTARSSSR